MRHTSQTIALFAMAAAAALPGIASAQTAGSQQMDRGMAPSTGAQMQPQMQPSQMDRGGARDMTQPSGSMPQQAGSMAQGRSVPINGQFTFPLANGCNYSATVQGTAQATRESARGQDALFTPNVAITASVTCPNHSTLRVMERIPGDRPMTLAKLQDAIELRASLVTDNQGLHCAYVPHFRLSEQRLEGVGAALLCPLPANAVRGGGPSGLK